MKLYVQYDDGPSEGVAPFSHTPSTWDLVSDFYLQTKLTAFFVSEVAGYTSSGEIASDAYCSRGLPRDPDSVLDGLEGEPVAGWITLEELLGELGRADIESRPDEGLSLLFSILSPLGERFGVDRVRVVFAIVD